MADTCPKCAYPINSPGSSSAPMGQGGKIQTVEQTSKKFKLHQMIAIVLFVIGLIIVALGYDPEESKKIVMSIGALIAAIGVIWIFWIKAKIWWHHG